MSITRKIVYIVLFGVLISATTAIYTINTGWESGDVLQGVYYPYSLCNKPYDAQRSQNYARTGVWSVRFESRSTDTACGASNRSELYWPYTTTPGMEFYYAWSFLVPENYTRDLTNIHVVGQMHDSTGNPPPWGISITKGKFIFETNYNLNVGDTMIHTVDTLLSVTTENWHDWVVYQKVRSNSSGILQVYHNSVLLLEKKGMNFSPYVGRKPYGRFGVYNYRWATNPPNPPDTIVAYYDNVRVGDSTTNLNDYFYQYNTPTNFLKTNKKPFQSY